MNFGVSQSNPGDVVEKHRENLDCVEGKAQPINRTRIVNKELPPTDMEIEDGMITHMKTSEGPIELSQTFLDCCPSAGRILLRWK
jgi:hypothetical protein